MAGYVHKSIIEARLQELQQERARLHREADEIRRRKHAAARPYQPGRTVDYSPHACAYRLAAAAAEVGTWRDPRAR